MNDNHTPGPWTYERGFRDVWNSTTETHSTAPDDFLTVCLYPDTETAPEISDNLAEVHGPNQEANAELIAKAWLIPELLEVCRAVESALGHVSYWKPEMAPALAGELRSVIDKATKEG